jgi:hypothetical protein
MIMFVLLHVAGHYFEVLARDTRLSDGQIMPECSLDPAPNITARQSCLPPMYASVRALSTSDAGWTGWIMLLCLFGIACSAVLFVKRRIPQSWFQHVHVGCVVVLAVAYPLHGAKQQLGVRQYNGILAAVVSCVSLVSWLVFELILPTMYPAPSSTVQAKVMGKVVALRVELRPQDCPHQVSPGSFLMLRTSAANSPSWHSFSVIQGVESCKPTMASARDGSGGATVVDGWVGGCGGGWVGGCGGGDGEVMVR